MAKLSYSHCKGQNVVHELAFVTYKTGVSDDNNMCRLHVSSPIKMCFTGLQDHATHLSTKHIIIAMQQNVGTESTLYNYSWQHDPHQTEQLIMVHTGR